MDATKKKNIILIKDFVYKNNDKITLAKIKVCRCGQRPQIKNATTI